MHTGTITYSSGKGWFFAESDDGRNIFVHQSTVEGHRFLHVDDRISFEIIENPNRPGRLLAQSVKYLGHTIAVQRSAVRP